MKHFKRLACFFLPIVLAVGLLTGCDAKGTITAHGVTVVEKPAPIHTSYFRSVPQYKYTVVLKVKGETFTFRVEKSDYEMVSAGNKVTAKMYKSSGWKARLYPETEGDE